ncbi:MAG: acetyl-CoA C-acyltransferase [Bacteriovoracaceae bacterium]|nr:acetyl-CoA C-acyltransferase [Bacteriovoracaceae bacterium]
MSQRPVYIVAAKRTPQVKSGSELKDVAAPFLGHYLIRQMVSEFNISDVDEVIVGNTGTPAKYANVARVVGLEAGLDKKTSCYSVHRNCASGMEAISQGFDKISLGRSSVIFAGGVENMTQMPLIYGKKMTDLFAKLMRAKTPGDRIKAIMAFRPNFLKPIVAIEQGLTDPFCGKNMGQTAELLAKELNITRKEQDEFADWSHKKAVAAQKAARFKDEIIPIIYGEDRNRILDTDVGPRDNSSVESLSKMKPYFEPGTGTVTIGNSCPITDGGAMVLLADEATMKKNHWTPMARIVEYHFHGLEPERMGMGPLLAMHGALARAGKKMSDMDLIEVNEAFAAQALAVMMACKDSKISSRWGINETVGEIARDKINVNGGAIALGHPVGCSGARIIVTLAHEMQKRKVKTGIASLCIGGGQGGAMIIERV